VRIEPKPSEVWFADLGMAAKNRPVLVLSVPGDDDARALLIVAPLTSQIRGMRGEVDLGKPRWLPKHSAVNVQGLANFDRRSLSQPPWRFGLGRHGARESCVARFVGFVNRMRFLMSISLHVLSLPTTPRSSPKTTRMRRIFRS